MSAVKVELDADFALKAKERAVARVTELRADRPTMTPEERYADMKRRFSKTMEYLANH